MTIPNDWKTLTLEECCEVLDRYRIPVNSEERGARMGEFPYYGANGLQGYIDGYIFDEPLILIAEDGGRFDEYATRPIAYSIHGKSWVNNHAHVLRAKSDFDQTAIFFSLEHKDIQHIIVGGTRAKLNQSALKKIQINLPDSKKEQAKIAEILLMIDQAIEQTETLIAKQQRIKTGLMQDLLTRGIDEHGQLRTEATHAFKDSPLGRIPVEWEVALLGEAAEISAGITLGKLHEGPDTEELPYLRVANVQDGYMDLTEVKSIRVPKSHIEKYTLKDGDVLMNEGGDFDKLGRGAVWRNQLDTCLHQNHVFKVRPQPEKLASDYLAAVSASPYGKTFFMMASKQSTNLASINSTQLKAFPIPMPSYKEQLRIQSQFGAFSEVLNGSALELKKHSSLKTALMQDLLTGRKRVHSLIPNEVYSS
jgi:type I restriction enzyme S subunit